MNFIIEMCQDCQCVGCPHVSGGCGGVYPSVTLSAQVQMCHR